MHEELRKKSLKYIILIILQTVSWYLIAGVYGLIVTVFLSILFYCEYKKESERLDAGLPKTDERSLKIAGKTGMVVFRVMLFWLIGLLFYHILSDIPNPILPILDVPIVIIASMFVLMLSAFIASYYYDKQGDF